MARSDRSGGKGSSRSLGRGFGGDAGGRGVGKVEGVEGLVEVALLGCDCLGHSERLPPGTRGGYVVSMWYVVDPRLLRMI